MEILKKTELPKNTVRDAGSMGIYDKFILDEERLDALLGLDKENLAVIKLAEIGSDAKGSTGCVYGFNKTFVAGCIPLKAKTHGKESLVVYSTEEFSEENYATDESIKTKKSNTAYEQPSPGQMTRVRAWLKAHGYAADGDGLPSEVEEEEEPTGDNTEESTVDESIVKFESDTFNNM